MISIKDINRLISWGNYHVNVEWNYLHQWISTQRENGLELYPDFQRGRVWTEDQKVKYIEFCLRGGKSGRNILFNCPNYTRTEETEYVDFVIVDGLQRLTTVMDFLDSKIPVFNGNYFSDFIDDPRVITRGQRFDVYINQLQSKKEVLNWYLEINIGGTPHSQEEIDRVKYILTEL